MRGLISVFVELLEGHDDDAQLDCCRHVFACPAVASVAVASGTARRTSSVMDARKICVDWSCIMVILVGAVVVIFADAHSTTGFACDVARRSDHPGDQDDNETQNEMTTTNHFLRQTMTTSLCPNCGCGWLVLHDGSGR